MSSAQRLAFLELKKRLTILELQHNTLTSICTVLAKQIKDESEAMEKATKKR